MPSSPASPGPEDSQHAAKLCAVQGSKLVFSTYDHRAASGSSHGFRNVSAHHEGLSGRRIVIELTTDGFSAWRFVPNANRELGVDDEGEWPRQVNVCGEIRELSENEWDMFKLDDDFVCTVKRVPHLSTVVRATPPMPQTPPARSSPVPPLRNRIHRIVPKTSKTAHREPESRPSDSDVSSDEDEVNDMLHEEMDCDFTGRRKRLDTDLLKKVRRNKEEARRFRRAKNAQFKRTHPPNFTFAQEQGPIPGPSFLNAVNRSPDDIRMMTPQDIPTRPPPQPGSPTPVRPAPSTPNLKRRASDDRPSIARDNRSAPNTDRRSTRLFDFTGDTKRTKNMSLDAAQRELRQKRHTRDERRRAERDRRARARSERINQEFMHGLYTETENINVFVEQDYSMDEYDGSDDLYEETPTAGPSNSHAFDEPVNEEASHEQSSQEPDERPEQESSQETPTPEPPIIDEEALRQAKIEESRRKMAELEADRPLWEEAARQRAAREEKERRQREAARRAKEAEEEAARRAEAEAEKRREAERIAREQAAAQDNVRARRRRLREEVLRPFRSRSSLWGHREATRRFNQLSEAFDRLNFHKGDIIIFETIPWPMLLKPGSFSVEHITWQEVERFFEVLRMNSTSAEFKSAVDRTHKRFHPDRWRSRRVLSCVEDEEERECLETAANVVAQALTPLWKEVTGR